MNLITPLNYNTFVLDHGHPVTVTDHLGGFDPMMNCDVLAQLVEQGANVIQTEYIANDQVNAHYPELDIKFNLDLYLEGNFFNQLHGYTMHPEIDYKNFVCSFNGSAHIARKLLVASLQQFGYYNPDYVSNAFEFTVDNIDGHIYELVGDRSRYYRKFFVGDGIDKFEKKNAFDYNSFQHQSNIVALESRLTQSFVNIVSETLASSYHPFVTEKFLYSVLTRGLFVAYAQPGWHKFLEQKFGFQLYNKIFDYQFDLIANPVERLISLLCMLSRFQQLATDDWRDLYHMEQDAIEYNYDHYHSRAYQRCLAQYE